MRIFCCCVFVMYSFWLSAQNPFYDAQINGIYYKFNKNTNEATVAMGVTEYTIDPLAYHPTKRPSYSGDVVIPESIVYEGNTYLVSAIQGRSESRMSEDPTGYGAFEGCSEMTSITLPSSIKTIGFRAFDGCYSLNAVYISDLSAWCKIDFSLEGLSYSYSSECNPLSLAHQLFINGEKISELIIPEDVTTIKQGSFIGCDISSVYFHKKVSSIGYDVFYNCQSLTDVYSYSPKISVVPYSYFQANDGTFKNASEMMLHIRKRYEDSYTNDYEWKKFGTLKYLEGIDFNLKYLVDGEIYKEEVIEVGETITPETAPTKDGYTFSGWSDIPEIMPNHDVIVYGSFIPNTPSDKCNKPTISFGEGKLEFNSETDGAECHYEIKVEDAKEGVGSEVTLSSAYEISVYASKEGYNDSEKNKAILYWINVDPISTGIIDNEMRVNTIAILVQNNGRSIFISGVGDGVDVMIYNISGQLIGQGKATDYRVVIDTNLSNGDICIIKIGDRSVKYILR